VNPNVTAQPEQPQAAPLLEQLRPKLEALIASDIHTDVDRENVVKYANARKNDLYYAGKQYIYPTKQNGQIVDWTASNGHLTSQAGDGGRTYDYVLNFIRGDGAKAIAVLSQRAVNVKAMSDREDDDAGRRRARIADTMARLMRANWRMDSMQRSLALSLWKNGTTFLYTPWVVNGAKYGTTSMPVLEMVEQPGGEAFYDCVQCGSSSPESQAPMGSCPQCATPFGEEDRREPEPVQSLEQTGVKDYSNGSVELILATIFEVTTPFYIKDLSEAPWLWYEFETHKGALLSLYPQLREMFKSDSGSNGEPSSTASGRMARDTASSPSKTQYTARKNRWLYSRYWLRPTMYQLIADGDNGEGQAIREQLLQAYPDGVKVTAVNGKIVDLQHECLDEVWTAIKPQASEYLYADPLCQDYLGPQDIINDMFNLYVESAERSIPFTLYDPQVLDPEMIARHRATPLELVPAKPGVGGSLREGVHTPEVAKVNPESMNLMSLAKDVGRENAGIQPALFGGDDGVEQTAKEATMKRNQALMQLNTTWNAMGIGQATAMENAAIQFAKYSDGRVVVYRGAALPPQVTEISGIEELAEGGWHYEAEPSMPMTWGERSDKVWSLLNQANPAAMQVLGIVDQMGLPEPENIRAFQEAIGLPDWKVPKFNDLEKIYDTINMAAQQEAIQTPDPMTGQPQWMSTIPVDEFEDDHMFVAQTVMKWRRQRKQGSFAGRAREPIRTSSRGASSTSCWRNRHPWQRLREKVGAKAPTVGAVNRWRTNRRRDRLPRPTRKRLT
jgi:hypothetical protein